MSALEIIRSSALMVFGAAATCSLLSFRYHYPTNLRRLSVLWVALFTLDVYGHILGKIGPNHWLYNVFSWIWYPSLAYLYYHELEDNLVRKIIRIFLIAFPLFILADCLFIEGITKLQTHVIVFGGAFVVFMATAYFRHLYNSEGTQNITRDPWFWFSFGFIIYFAGGSVPFLGMLNYLTQNDLKFAANYYHYIYLSLTVLLHLLILIGFVCRVNYRKLH